MCVCVGKLYMKPNTLSFITIWTHVLFLRKWKLMQMVSFCVMELNYWVGHNILQKNTNQLFEVLTDSFPMFSQSLSLVQLFYYPIDCNLPGSSVHGISQEKILEWVAISFSIPMMTRTNNRLLTILSNLQADYFPQRADYRQ